MQYNKLKELRNTNDLSLRELTKYTGVANAVISYLENGQRPFRQEHIDILCAFFKVTSDYLMGRSDIGIIVHYEDGDGEEIILSQNEFDKYRTQITSEIIRLSDDGFEIKAGTKSVIFPRYAIYRELKLDSKSIQTSEMLNSKISSLCKTMTNAELSKTIKFIEEYILNK